MGPGILSDFVEGSSMKRIVLIAWLVVASPLSAAARNGTPPRVPGIDAAGSARYNRGTSEGAPALVQVAQRLRGAMDW